MKHTYARSYAANYAGKVVTVPDAVAADQEAYVDVSFLAIRADGSKVRVKVNAEATGLGTGGTGDLVLKSA